MNYYARTGFTSNSDLGTFKKELYGIKPLPNIQEIYDFGNLVDAMALERHRVNFAACTVDDMNAVFTDTQMELAKKMARAVDDDKFASQMLGSMQKQYAFYRSNFMVNYNGYRFRMKARCKFDGIKKGDIGADLKTTACKTEKQFIQSFDFFDYDRQAAWYMDLAGIDRMVYIAVSKEWRPQVFKLAIDRNHHFYKSGRAKYERLAFQYKHLIIDFNIAA